MPFKPGTSGNPEGRPQGRPDRRTQLKKLLEPHAEGLISKAVELALEGDIQALKICLDRLIPKVSNEAIQLDITNNHVNQAEFLLAFGNKLIDSVSLGEISPEQGKVLSSMLESQRKLTETVELVERVIKLEGQVK